MVKVTAGVKVKPTRGKELKMNQAGTREVMFRQRHAASQRIQSVGREGPGETGNCQAVVL